MDIGLIDTMKDMLVNCLGAIIFSIFGFFYIRTRGKGKVASSFIPQLKTEEEIEATEAMLRARKDEIKNKKDKK